MSARQAILYALEKRWQEALQENIELLDEDPADTGAILRAAKAYQELGNFQKATEYAKMALDVDPGNNIAKNCIEKCQIMANGGNNHNHNPGKAVKPTFFIEEPGKTKIVPLAYLGDKSKLNYIDCGDEVRLESTSKKISIHSQNGDYIGRVPDNIAMKLTNEIKSGNEFKAFIKSIEGKEIQVFLKKSKPL